MKMKQTTFASLAFAAKGKRTRRECFLAEMDAVIPWTQFVGLIEPCYPKAGNGRTPFDCETMLRIYFMQHWFNLSDPAAEDALYDSESMRRFAKLEFIDDALPDETTHPALSASAGTASADRAHLCGSSRLAFGPASAAQRRHHRRCDPHRSACLDQERDPHPRSRDDADEEGQPVALWHEGTHRDEQTRAVHTLSTTTAATADSTELPKLLHGEEAELYGDRAYWNEQDRIGCREVGMRYRVNRRAKPNRPLNQRQRAVNRSRSRIRARGEHAFRIIKCLWGFTKVRYRGLAKNTARAFAAFALANLYLVRRRLAQPRDSYAP